MVIFAVCYLKLCKVDYLLHMVPAKGVTSI